MIHIALGVAGGIILAVFALILIHYIILLIIRLIVPIVVMIIFFLVKWAVDNHQLFYPLDAIIALIIGIVGCSVLLLTMCLGAYEIYSKVVGIVGWGRRLMARLQEGQ